MKYILIFCLSLLGFTNAFAQANTQNDNDKVYVIVQTQPKFHGEVNKYLSDSINYPEDAKAKNQQGTVYVSFVVEKDGSVSTVKILRGVCPSLDNESVRVISHMPKWTPGMQNEHAVRVSYTVPIRYKLKDDILSTPPPPPKQNTLQNPFK
ncbi:MAG TPA: energy transducer TonB [Bacteroidia bacterium]|nr:energy transducer TonB [Bacteroidia bacterium]